jgi:hypothetical protein
MGTGTGIKVGLKTSGMKSLMPGGPGTQPGAVMDAFIYEAAQVEDIVTNQGSELAASTSATANIGRAKIRFINTDKGVDSNDLPWADPLLPYQTSYPLVGEYVLVFKMLGTYWYIGPLNTKRKITQNAAPITGLLQSQPTNKILQNKRASALGVLTQATVNPNKVGKDFKEAKVNPLKAFEGDILYQGRYGQSIRLGSSQMIQSSFGEQNPNIIIRVGQGPETGRSTEDGGPQALTNESLNTDPSSMWMVSKQILGLIPATFGTNIHLRSVLDKPVAFDGASILINSDRLIFNSKATSIFLFAKKGIHMNALEDGITVDTSGPIILKTPNEINLFSEKTLDITGKEDILIATKRDVTISGDRNITVLGNEIFLGGRNSLASPIVLAKPLKMFLMELLRTLMSTQPLTLGPTGVVNPALIARLLVVYTKYMVFPDPFNPMWASNDTFAMKTNERTMAGDLPANESFKNVSGLGTVGRTQAAAFGRQQANNAGLKDLRKLYDEELISKL